MTTVLGATKPEADARALADWRMKDPERADAELRNGAERGTLAHLAMEKVLVRDVPGLRRVWEEAPPGRATEEARVCFETLRPWAAKVERLAALELPVVVGPGLGVPPYAGTVDLVADVVWPDGEVRRTVVDWKTAGRPKPREWIEDYWLQVAAYAGGLNLAEWECPAEYRAPKVAGGVVVLAPADGSPLQEHWIPKGDLEARWEGWVDRLQAFWLSAQVPQ